MVQHGGPLRDKINDVWGAFHRGDFDEGMNHYSPDCTVYFPTLGALDKAGWAQTVRAYFAAHPDFLVEITDSVEDEDTVAFRWQARGTRTEPMPHPQGVVPPSGSLLNVSGTAYVFVENDLITHYHLYLDGEEFFDHRREIEQNVQSGV